jgi:hypothetical protein
MSELVLYDEMCRAIAAAHGVDEVKDIRDKALAIEVYSRQAKNIENEMRAIEIRIRAERRCGELLAEMDKAKPPGSNQHELRSHDATDPPTLADLGISKDQSSRWQKLAAVPQEDFEATFAGSGKPSTNGIITAHGPKKTHAIDAVDDNALWLWGRLLDFERNGLLEQDPNETCDSMLDHMKEAVRELAPRVAAWLDRIEG